MGLQSVNGVNAQTQTQGTETKLYDTKAKRKAAINQAISDFMKYGRGDDAKIYSNEKEYKAAVKAQNKERKAFVKEMHKQGKTKAYAREQFDNQAQKLALAKDEAKKYVKNEQHKEEFETFNENTTVYADKKAYKAAKKEAEAARKELYKDLRAQGLSRKEAKAQADSQIQNVELASRSARKGFAKLGLVESDGTLGEKALSYMVEQANIGNDKEGEAISYHYELKERRATKANEKAQGNKLTLHQLGKMADAVHLHKEKNMTGPIRIGAAAAIIGATTGAAYAIGGITAGSASASTASASSVVEGVGSATAGATGFGAAEAVVGPAALATGASPLGVLGILFSDKGKKVAHTYAPGQPKPAPAQPPVTTPPVVKEKPCPTETWESEYCDHKVSKKGENWSNVAQGKVKINGKKLEGKMLRAYVHAEKLQHGVTDFTQNTFMKKGENYRLYTDFSNLLENEEIIKKHPELLLLKDAKIEIDCDGKYTVSNDTKPKHPFLKYTGNPIETNKYKQSCDDQVPVRTNNK